MKLFKTWTFKWWEIGLLKLSLVSLGILLGLYFQKYLIGLTWLWWLLFVVIALYLMMRFFKEKDSTEQ